MAVVLLDGQRRYEDGGRDAEGHRTYKVVHLVQTSILDGPSNAMQCPGLPLPHSIWQFDNDVDVWAFCTWDMSIRSMTKDGPNQFFEIEQTFTTKPPDTKSCIDVQVDDPLLIPQKVSGSYLKDKEEITHDRFGKATINSAFEQIRGPGVEFDKGSDTVIVEQNVPLLQLELFTPMKDTVNQFPLWGLPKRCIKLSDTKYDRKYYGQCFEYYTRTFTFEIKTKRNTGAVSATPNNPNAEAPFKVGDLLEVQGGLATIPAVLVVTAIDNAGHITTVDIYSTGSYTTVPNNPVSVIDDTGAAVLVTFTVNWSDVSSITSGFDRDLVDEGTKVLRGKWDKDPKSPTYQTYIIDDDPKNPGKKLQPNNPLNFIKFRDFAGDLAKVILDGLGQPYNPDKANSLPGNIHIERYTESDFTLLQIPLMI
jgi:hypothetical protein